MIVQAPHGNLSAMPGSNPTRDEQLLEQGLTAVMEVFASAKQAWELEEIVRDLIPPDFMATPLGGELADTIVEQLSRMPVGVSALHVMGLVATPLAALKARSAVERIVDGGGPQPSALARRCGGLRPVQVWRMEAGDGGEAFLIQCRRQGAKRVQVVAITTIESDGLPILIEGSFSEPLDEAAVGDLVHSFDLRGQRPHPLTLQEAGAALLGLAMNNITVGRGPTPDLFPVLIAVLPYVELDEWEGLVTALGQLPLAEFNEDDDDEWDEADVADEPPLTDAESTRIEREIEDLTRRFDEWIAPRETDVELRHTASFVAQLGFEYRAWYCNEVPWTPEMVGDFFLAHIPRKASIDAEDIAGVPAALHHLITFLNDIGQVPARTAALMSELVTASEASFVEAMSDSSNFGMAKTMGRLMEADGVDVTDREALERWMADFNSLPVEQRKELLPDSVLPGASRPAPPPAPPPGQKWPDREAPRRKRTAARSARKKNRRRGR